MHFITVTLLFSLLGCSMGQVRQSPHRSAPSEKNVPYKAREDFNSSFKKRVIVLPFLDAKLQRSENVVNVARSTVVRDVIATRQYIVVSNSDIPKEIKKYITNSNEYDMKAVSKVAASMGVTSIIEGKILEIKARRIGDEVGVFRKLRARVEVKVRIRMFAAHSGKEVMNEVRTATIESETTRVAKYSYSDRFLEEDPVLVRNAVKKAFRGTLRRLYQSIEKLSWEGRVAMVSGDRIFINAGRLSGIQVGDVLKVTEEGEEVYDPENGLFIGSTPGRMKGTVEIISYFGKDGSIGVIHSGSGFKENDRVELY